MNTYLLRFANTTKISGIFWANSIHELFWAVDEMGDPGAFEYATISMSGGIWNDTNEDDSAEAIQYNATSGVADDDPGILFSHFTSVSDSVSDVIWKQSTKKWKTFGEPGQYYD